MKRRTTEKKKEKNSTETTSIDKRKEKHTRFINKEERRSKMKKITGETVKSKTPNKKE